MSCVKSQLSIVENGRLWMQRGVCMKRLNTHEIYTLGKTLLPISDFAPKGYQVEIGPYLFPMLRAKMAIGEHIGKEGIFSPSCKRAAAALLRSFRAAGLPETFDAVLNVDRQSKIASYLIEQVAEKLKEFETVLANEMPGIPTYYVRAKGIYSTDDLISNSVQHIPVDLQKFLPMKANTDVNEAGKCLAFELATATAFHTWRAVESVMDAYHKTLTGKSFSEAGITRNWGQYIEALKNAKAPEKITGFLDFIRKEYRNPNSHPEEFLELDEAFNLFGTGLSAIGQMLREIEDLEEKKSREASAVAPAETAAISSLPSLRTALGGATTGATKQG